MRPFTFSLAISMLTYFGVPLYVVRWATGSAGTRPVDIRVDGVDRHGPFLNGHRVLVADRTAVARHRSVRNRSEIRMRLRLWRRCLPPPVRFSISFAAFDPIVVVAVNGQKDAAAFDAAFVSFGLILRYSHTDQRADNASDSAQGASARQSRYNRAGSDKHTADAGNRFSIPSAGQPSEHPARDGFPTRRPWWRLPGPWYSSRAAKSPGAGVIRKQRRDIGVQEVGAPEGDMPTSLLPRTPLYDKSKTAVFFPDIFSSPDPCRDSCSNESAGAKGAAVGHHARIVCINQCEADYQIEAKRCEDVKSRWVTTMQLNSSV